jgi:8-oxo-dGTP pyrophosphatase MutT (NUDIX family)
MTTLIQIVKETNNVSNKKIQFLVNGILVGFMSPAMIPHLKQPLELVKDQIHFNSTGTREEKTILLEELFLKWRKESLFPCLKGWRNERYSVFGPEGILLDVERAACGLVGVRTYGCHLNGFVRTVEGLKMWVGKRSKTKQTYPGMLDQMVAGGLASGSKPSETIVKECHEEAGIPAGLAENAIPVGFISFWKESEFEMYSLFILVSPLRIMCTIWRYLGILCQCPKMVKWNPFNYWTCTL